MAERIDQFQQFLAEALGEPVHVDVNVVPVEIRRFSSRGVRLEDTSSLEGETASDVEGAPLSEVQPPGAETPN